MGNYAEHIKNILALVNNASDLIVVSNQRKEARDVIKAMSIYAKAKQTIIPEDDIEDFYARLIDSPPYKLKKILSGIAYKIIENNSKKITKTT